MTIDRSHRSRAWRDGGEGFACATRPASKQAERADDGSSGLPARRIGWLAAIVFLASLCTSVVEAATCTPKEALPATARAVRIHEYGGPEQLKVESIPRPRPAADEVLVKVVAASVNPVDWKLREGELKSWWPLTLPAVLGRDASGVIVEVGKNVKDFHCGDDVVVLIDRSPQGSYAEYIAVNVNDMALKPKSMTYVEAAAYPLVGITAWNSLIESARLRAGERVLIQGGAGGVGSMAVQMAKARGAYVITTASERNREFLKSIGADEVIDYKTTRFEDVVHGVDVVLDTVGGETLQRSVSVLKPGGRLFSVAGSVTAETCASAKIECPKEAGIDIRPAFREIGRLIDAGKLHVQIDRVYSLDQVAQAQELNRAGHTRGKIVLRVAD